MEKADSWYHGLSPSSRQDRLELALLALKGLANAGLGAASVLANLHHMRIVPLMERSSVSTIWARRPTLCRWRARGCCTTASPGVCGHECEARHQP
jgi:hypothetical protein